MDYDANFLRNVLLPVGVAFGALTGLAGTVMGIINLVFTWRSHNTDIGIQLQLARSLDENGNLKTPEPSAEVTNRSYFPVTISKVGLIISKGRGSALH